MKLSKLLGPLALNEPVVFKDIDITDIIYDSRKVTPGCMFVCLRGHSVDGHLFARSAAERGAAVIVAEEQVDVPETLDIQVVICTDTKKALALMSAAYFGNPAETALKVIGITGTKGKTTTALMIRAILEAAGKKTGVIGTIGVMIGEETIQTENTTPASYDLQRYFRKMADAGCTYCVMEVSSIGLKDARVYGFTLDIGLFTNFSEDHIGGVEHKDMEEYLQCKQMLFRMCQTGVINIDDPSWKRMTEDCSCSLKTYSFEQDAWISGKEYRLLSDGGLLGISFKTDGAVAFQAEVGISGRFNAYNALAAIACCELLGVSAADMNKGLRTVRVKGRMERVPVPGSYTLLIDYAHNAVSMESLLKTLREYEPKRLICMFGAGGNRPKLRRYEMGEVCGKMADLSVITEDNSRDEDVMDIIADIQTGMAKTDGVSVVIPDRREAIRYCITNAQDGDVIVLAGKGHESYQEKNGRKLHFDEREVITEILEEIE